MKIQVKLNNFIFKVFWEFESILQLFLRKLKHKRTKKIRVVFIVQYIPAWNKSETVYHQMKSNTKFEVFLLCVPSEIQNCKLDERIKINSTYEYFKMHGYENLVNAMLPSGNWFDLNILNPDYVFYTRPYNNYLPYCYVPRMVSKYAKTCLILYAFFMSKESIKTHVNIIEFYKYLYFYFSDSAFATSYYKRKNSLRIKFGLQKVVNSGYPVLETIMAKKNEKTDLWHFSNNSFRVIWTPRWTTDLNAGGSNFFKYKDFLINLAAEKNNIDFLFRPHPLALNHFIQTGEMTVEEVKEFRNNCERIGNLFLDETEEYIPTIWNSSVLISDISAFVVEYFVTGKPIIFCPAHTTIEFLDEIKKIIYEGCYVANNEEDIQKYIDEIQCGNDYLKQKRHELISEIWGDDFENISKVIVDNIILDHLK